MKKFTLLSVAASMLLSSVIGVSAAETIMPNEDGSYTVNAEVAGVAAGSMYGILAVKGDAAVDTITEADIMYIDQITATEAGKISLAKFGLLEATESTLYVGGAGLDGATEIAVLGVKVEVKGNTISGKVTSYNPNNATTITLWKDGAATEYTATIAAATGNGKVTSDFVIEKVPAGTYNLVVTKAGHVKYTVTDIVVADTADTPVAVPSITMLCGDVNGDGSINGSDVNVIYKGANFYKSITEAADPVADLNGDSSINGSDVNIIYQEAHFYKGEANSTVPFSAE